MRRAVKRVGISFAGTMLILAGLAMLILPGPGLLTIAAGLAVLATEFVWAERLLTPVRRRVNQAKSKLHRSNPSGPLPPRN